MMLFEDMSHERRAYELEMRVLDWWPTRIAYTALCGVLAPTLGWVLE